MPGRSNENVMNENLKRTPLYEELTRRGGKFVPFAGYEMAVQFEGIKAEHQAVRNAVGLFDVSHMGEIWLEGKDALSYADYLVTNDLFTAENQKVMYSPMCMENGCIVDDLFAYIYSPEKVLLVANASNRHKDLAHIQQHVRGDVRVTDKSDETGQIALQGPNAVQLTAAVSDDRFKDLQRFHFVEGEAGGVHCLISRTGYTGEDGYEIYCKGQDMVKLFLALEAAGGPFGLKPIGLGARDTLRLESRLSLYGNDIDDTTTPLEAGLAWTVKLDTGRDFLGKAALLQQEKQGLTRRLAGFEMTDKAIARHGYPVIRGNDPNEPPVGFVGSGSPSITLNKNIGLAYLPIDMTKKGTKFHVVIRGAAKEAVVVKTPFYRREP
jgi:aminomethyltransferase